MYVIQKPQLLMILIAEVLQFTFKKLGDVYKSTYFRRVLIIPKSIWKYQLLYSVGAKEAGINFCKYRGFRCGFTRIFILTHYRYFKNKYVRDNGGVLKVNKINYNSDFYIDADNKVLKLEIHNTFYDEM